MKLYKSTLTLGFFIGLALFISYGIPYFMLKKNHKEVPKRIAELSIEERLLFDNQRKTMKTSKDVQNLQAHSQDDKSAEDFESHNDKNTYSKLQKRIPQAIGIGNKKCSTGSLRLYVCHHPNVVCPENSETHYFDKDELYQKGTEFYRSQFPPSTSSQVTFEKTPKYFTRRIVPSRINHTYAEEHQSVKFLLLLCDPTMRVFSDYSHDLRQNESLWRPEWKDYKTFDEYVDHELIKFKDFLLNQGMEKLKKDDDRFYDSILAGHWGRFLKGLYFFHLERWYNFFPKNDFLIIDSDLLTKQPWKVMEDVQRFLNLPATITEKNFVMNQGTGFYCLFLDEKRRCLKSNTRSMSSEGKITSKMSESSQRMLNNFFKEYDNDLIKLLNEEFSWMQ